MYFGTFCKKNLGFSPVCVFVKIEADLKMCLDDMRKEVVIEKQQNVTDLDKVSSLPCTPNPNGKLPENSENKPLRV